MLVAKAGVVTGSDRALSPVPALLAELFVVAGGHERAGRLDDAERILGRILDAAPQQPDALHLAGIVAFRRRRHERALELFEASIRHGLNTPLYWRNIGEAYRVLGRLDEALAAGHRAVALNPDDPTALSNLALIHADRREIDQATACEQAALALAPAHVGARFGLAELLLLKGDMEPGWEGYEWRFRMPGGEVNLPPSAYRPPQWDGRALPAGRLLVIADQGFGDVIQFARYIPWILARCPDPCFACSPEIGGVLAHLGARRRRHAWAEIPPCEAYVPLSGLPRLAGTRLSNVPADVPYLHADPVRACGWRERLDRLLPPRYRRIGLVWAGRPTHANDRRRSTTLAALMPLFAMDGVAFVSLQKGERQGEIGHDLGPAPLLNLGPALRSWDDTMAVIDGLDAVVTVDTAVAHLAGAMGRPVHILLPHAAEWRWLEHRSDSPWYPTARLHRRGPREGWDAVAERAADALRTAFAQAAPSCLHPSEPDLLFATREDHP